MTDKYVKITDIKYGYDDHLELDSDEDYFFLYWDDIPYLYGTKADVKHELYVKEVKDND